MRLQAALNGARPADTRHLPLTPAAIAADALACRMAGADCLHLHPRDAEARESLFPDDVADVLNAVRAAVPGMAVGISTGDWIVPRLGRLRDMESWSVLPDFVSVNLAEPDAEDVLALMRRRGIGIELGLGSVADLERLIAMPGDPTRGAVRVMIEMDTGGFATARHEAGLLHRMLAQVMPGVPQLLHGFEQSAWEFVALARDWGCQTRIGLEDVLLLPGGEPGCNAQMVAQAQAILGAANRVTDAAKG